MTTWQNINGDLDQNPASYAALPEWFDHPRPYLADQRTLFSSPLSEILADLRVSTDELARWHQRGWVSFGAERSRLLEQWDRDEIQFVRDVARSGLSDAQIECLFAQLPRPMNSAVDRIAYSFTFGWVVAVPPPPEPDLDEMVSDHLDDWLDRLDVDDSQLRLIALRNRINTLLETAGHSSDEEPD